jgi:hypothetical protein
MKQIKLTGGKIVLVDNEDFEYLNQWKWYLGRDGYAYRTKFIKRINGKLIKKNISMHRYLAKTPKGLETDHINHNRLDNRKKNLRIVTATQNRMNNLPHKNNSSGYKGVSWDKTRNKWIVFIKYNGKGHNVGRFSTKEEAALVYNKMAEEHFGQYAYLNQI